MSTHKTKMSTVNIKEVNKLINIRLQPGKIHPAQVEPKPNRGNHGGIYFHSGDNPFFTDNRVKADTPYIYI